MMAKQTRTAGSVLGGTRDFQDFPELPEELARTPVLKHYQEETAKAWANLKANLRAMDDELESLRQKVNEPALAARVTALETRVTALEP